MPRKRNEKKGRGLKRRKNKYEVALGTRGIIKAIKSRRGYEDLFIATFRLFLGWSCPDDEEGDQEENEGGLGLFFTLLA